MKTTRSCLLMILMVAGVGAICYGIFRWSHQDPSNDTANTAANAPAAAANAAPASAEAPAEPAKREAQPGDVIWWEVRYRDNKPVAIFETVLEKKKDNGWWIIRGKFVHSGHAAKIELTHLGWVCSVVNPEGNTAFAEVVNFDGSSEFKVSSGLLNSIDAIRTNNLQRELDRLNKYPLKE